MTTKQYDAYSDLIAFTRASTGTYLDSDGLLKTATTNTPRIEYDANGNRKGLLIEEARTNLILQSGNLAVSPWTVNNVTTSVDAGAAPDGSDMTLLTSTGADSDTGSIQSTAASVGTTYTASVFVRRDQHRFAMLFGFGNGSSGVAFDLVLGTAQVNATWVSAGIDIISPTIARIYGVVTPLAHGDLYVGLASGINGGKIFSGGEALSFWGAQLEAGSFPTSYIPTAGIAASRSADVASIPTSAFGYNADKGTVVCEFSTAIVTSVNEFALSDGTNNNRIVWSLRSFVGRLPFISASGVNTVALVNDNGIQNATLSKVAIAFAENDVASSLDGQAVLTDTTATIPNNINILYLGVNAVGNGAYINGHIKSIQYYPRRLTNTQLQELTS